MRDGVAAAGGALLAFVFALRLFDGSYASLVQGWYEPVLVVSAVALGALAVASGVVVFRHGGPGTLSWRPVTLAAIVLGGLPLVLGLAYKPEPLTSASLPADTDATTSWSAGASAAADPSQRNVYQWAYEFANTEPAVLIGQEVDLIAFVYHQEGDLPGQFRAARFVVACCVADARGYTLPVQWPEAGALQADQWVRVQGQVALGPTGEPVILASGVESLSAPSNPYIYP